ncbi:MAG: DUF4089 domain-containing protein [Gemmatimonadales bacterium]
MTAFVDATSAVIALPIDPAFRANVVEHFARLLTVAALVAEVPLPDDIEVAPVFHP